MYFDAHNHLQDAALAPHWNLLGEQLPAIGLAGAVVNGTCEEDWESVALLARRFAWVRPSFGVHPWDAGNRAPGWIDRLRTRLQAVPRASVGEIGIDRWIIDSARHEDPRLAGLRRAPLDEQSEVFLSQLALAVEFDRPATVHCLQAWGALHALLRKSARPARGFLLHAYNGPREMVAEFVRLGAYFSFNGAFLDPRKEAIRDAFRVVPEDRLLVETDAPAMIPPGAWQTHSLPPSASGAPVNHPGNIQAAYSGLAALRGLPVPDLIRGVADNFRRLFDGSAR